MDDLDELGSVTKYLSMISRLTSHYMNITLERYHLNYTQFVFLITLYRGDGLTQDELGKECYIDKAAVTRSVRDLEKKGYIIRRVGERDRRAKRLYLTTKALAIKKSIHENAQNWTKQLLAGFTAQEQKLLCTQVKTMFNSGKGYIKQMKF